MVVGPGQVTGLVKDSKDVLCLVNYKNGVMEVAA